MLKKLQTCVRDGIFWLDSNIPGWHKKINLEIFELNICGRCIVGQICGLENEEGIIQSLRYAHFLIQNHINDKKLGFNSPFKYEEEFVNGKESKYSKSWKVLTALWKREIVRLRRAERKNNINEMDSMYSRKLIHV